MHTPHEIATTKLQTSIHRVLEGRDISDPCNSESLALRLGVEHKILKRAIRAHPTVQWTERGAALVVWRDA